MMRYRRWEATFFGGLFAIIVASLNLITPLGNSLLLGFGIGMLAVAPAAGAAASLAGPKTAPVAPPAIRLKELVSTRQKTAAAERERALDIFDEVIDRVARSDDPETIREVNSKFKSFLDRLTRSYPEWDGEGRLRTYVLMKEISNSLDTKNAEGYLDMAYATLMARGKEAADLSKLTLNGKVERLYRDPNSDGTRRLAGTLLLMNRGDDVYSKGMVVDAIHLWSDSRFRRLRDDFATIPVLGPGSEESIIGMLEHEMRKAKGAKDLQAYARARQLKSTILTSPNKGISR